MFFPGFRYISAIQSNSTQSMRFSQKLALLSIFMGFTSVSLSQLTTYGAAPHLLSENFFCSDYIVSNTVYSGVPYAIGSFEIANGSIGLSEGIIMTSGTILDVNGGPYGPDNMDDAGIDNNYGGYGALSDMIGGVATFNAAVLEFDLFTLVDSIEFEVIFGSEEYLEFVGSQFNDAFAVFLSGPGIPGLQNIARLPSGQAININTVHPNVTNDFGASGAVNPQFYISNAGGSILQYDGYTTPIKVKADLQPNTTYHMIIAIADASDAIYDSGVFLQKCSANFNAGVSNLEDGLAHCYPNPAQKGEITMRSEKEVDYRIYKSSGEEMTNGTFKGEISIDGLDSGLYYVHITYAHQVSIVKIAVQ